MHWSGPLEARASRLHSLDLCLTHGARLLVIALLPVQNHLFVNTIVLDSGRYTQGLLTNGRVWVGLFLFLQWILFPLIKELGKTPPTPTSKHRLQLHTALTHTYGNREKAFSVAPLLLAEGRTFPTDLFLFGLFPSQDKTLALEKSDLGSNCLHPTLTT